MTEQSDVLETNHTIIQINNIKQNISMVEKSVDSIKIPGAKIFFKYVTHILNKDNPSDKQEILDELKRMDAKLDNSFNITLFALDVSNLQKNIDRAKSSMEEVSHLVRSKDPDYYKARIIAEVSNLHRLATQQIESGKTALEHFDFAKRTGNGELKALIGEYLKLSSFVSETISYMQYSYNMILQRNVELEGQLGKGFENSSDYKLGKEIEDYSETILNSYDYFLSNSLPGNVPKWCRKIFLGEEFKLNNCWCHRCIVIMKDGRSWVLGIGSGPTGPVSNFELNFDEDTALWNIYVSYYEPDGHNKKEQVFSSDYSNVYGETIPLLLSVDNKKRMRDKIDKYKILYDFERLIIQYPRKSNELIGAKTVGHADLRYEQMVTSKFKTSDEKAQWEVI